jgi:WhiB family transcriptional regulator, redox-sensing transcriptional regulator
MERQQGAPELGPRDVRATGPGHLQRREGPDVSWQDRAACRGMEMLFHGPDDEPPPEREIREAKAKEVCRQCPVRMPCLDFALSNSIKHGIWGGLNEQERARERRRRTRRPDAA